MAIIQLLGTVTVPYGSNSIIEETHSLWQLYA